jgi:hypothetical protein
VTRGTMQACCDPFNDLRTQVASLRQQISAVESQMLNLTDQPAAHLSGSSGSGMYGAGQAALFCNVMRDCYT